VGVAGAITKQQLTTEKGEWFGKAFEHFIFMEILAYNSYNERERRSDRQLWKILCQGKKGT